MRHIICTDTYLSILEPRHAGELFQLIDEYRDYISKWHVGKGLATSACNNSLTMYFMIYS